MAKKKDELLKKTRDASAKAEFQKKSEIKKLNKQKIALEKEVELKKRQASKLSKKEKAIRATSKKVKKPTVKIKAQPKTPSMKREFVLKGKPKTIKSAKPNFTKGSTGGPVVSQAKRTAVNTGKIKKAGLPTKFIDPNTIETTARKVGKKVVKPSMLRKGLGLAGKLAKKASIPASILLQDEVQAPTMTLEEARLFNLQQGSTPFPSEMLEEPEQPSTPQVAKVVKQAAPLAKELASQDKNLSKKDEKKIAKILKSEKSINKEIEKADSGNKSPVSNFTKALTFFAPQILGALGGAIGGGTEGALIGLEAGGQARDSFNQFQQDERKLEITEQKAEADLAPKPKAFQQTRDFGFRLKSGNIVPLFADPNTGNFLHPETKQPLTPQEMTKVISGETRRVEALNLANQKAAQLSDKQTKTFAEMDSVIFSIDRMDQLREEVNTGPLAGRVQTLKQFADLAPEKFNKLKVQTASTLSNYVKSISGAQVAEAEAIRLQAIIPSVNDAPELFEDKLQEFKLIMSANRNAFANTIATGQPLKAAAIKGLVRAEAKYKNSSPTPDPRQSAPVSNVTEADIDNMTKEELKAFLGE